MIRRLRRKLIGAAMLSLVLVIAVLLGVILVRSYRDIVSDADRILDLLASNQGAFPDLPPDFDWEKNGPRRHSPELGYETRYFSVCFDESGAIQSTDTQEIAAVDVATAQRYAKDVLARGTTRGFVGTYRYLVAQEGSGVRVIFLDHGGALFNFRSVCITSLWVAAAGLLAVFGLLWLFSRRIIRPVIQSDEKQKRFITDAGHEIKTPIAIIQADADVLALETEEDNEWIQDIRQQIQRLAALTNDLIYLSRMEEDRGRQDFLPLCFSDLVEETAQSFQTLARSRGKQLVWALQPLLTMQGEEKDLRQLVSILLDNAVKYAPAGGTISLTLDRQGKYLRLVVENPAEQLSKALLENMFDRFYRGDASRSSAQAGYGIGLSIAQAVVQAHRGKLTAAQRGQDHLAMTVLLPAE